MWILEGKYDESAPTIMHVIRFYVQPGSLADEEVAASRRDDGNGTFHCKLDAVAIYLAFERCGLRRYGRYTTKILTEFTHSFTNTAKCEMARSLKEKLV